MPSWLCGIEAVGEITVRLSCFPTYWTGMFQCARTQTVGTADEILSPNLHTHTEVRADSGFDHTLSDCV